MAVSSKKRKDSNKSNRKEQTFTVLLSKRIGSNKDGSAKESYTKGQVIKLSSKEKINSLKSLKII